MLAIGSHDRASAFVEGTHVNMIRSEPGTPKRYSVSLIPMGGTSDHFSFSALVRCSLR